MSVYFSDNHLRVPRGFCTILEGLAREVLRDQPADIPSYAASYFDALLKQREESGMDHAEWAAKLEDRGYKNNTLKAYPGEQPTTVLKKTSSSSEEQSSESHTEDETTHPVDSASFETSNQNASEDEQGTENIGDEQKNDEKEKDEGETDAVSTVVDLSKEASDDGPATDTSIGELCGSEEERALTVPESEQTDGMADDKYSISVADDNICQSELEPNIMPSLSGISDVDIHAKDLEEEEDEDEEGQMSLKQETDVGDEGIRDSSEEKQSTEPMEGEEAIPCSMQEAMEVCAQELETIPATVVGVGADDDPVDDDSATHTNEEESLKHQAEEITEALPPSLSEQPQNNLTEIISHTDKQLEEEINKNNLCSEVTDDNPITVDNEEDVPDRDNALEENTLVEINFEDVPEAGDLSENEEKQPEEGGLAQEVSQSEGLDKQPHQESEGITELETGYSIHDIQQYDVPASELDRVEKEVPLEPSAEEGISQQEAHDVDVEKVDSGSRDHDDEEMTDWLKEMDLSTSDQPDTEREGENLSNEIDLEDKDLHQEETAIQEDRRKSDNETNVLHIQEEDKAQMGAEHTEDAQADMSSEVEEKIAHEYGDDNAEVTALQVTQSSIFELENEEESSSVKANADISPEKDVGSNVSPVELQAEDEVKSEGRSRQQVSEAEEHAEEEEIDSDGQEKEDAVGNEDLVIPTQSTAPADDSNQDGHRPPGSERDGAQPEGKRNDEILLRHVIENTPK